MTSPRIIVLLALPAAGLATAPAGAAEPTPLLYARSAHAAVVAGTDVAVARRAPRGGLRVDALPSRGGPARRLLTLPPRSRRWFADATLAASPQRVAVAVRLDRTNTRGAIDRIEWRLYAGPTTGPLEHLVTAGQDDFAPVDVAVDGDRVVVLEVRFGENVPRLRVLDPGAAPRVLPWGGDVFSPIALAGGRLAFAGTETLATDEVDEIDAKLFVLDVASGARQLTLDLETPGTELDLAPDGRVVAEGVGLLTPGQPKTELPVELFSPRFAGTAVAGLERVDSGAVRPVVLDPGAATPRPIGLPSFQLPRVDADAGGLAWIAHDCVWFAPVGATAPAAPRAGPCPRAEAEVTSIETTLRGRRIRMQAVCASAPAAGCRGTVVLRRRGFAGRGRFRAAAGTVDEFTVRLTKRAARSVRARIRRHDEALLAVTLRLVAGGPPEHVGSILLNRVRGA
jgi:hypothetical protein